MLDFECQIIDIFGWSMYEIDETDIESLIPVTFRFPKWKKESEDKRKRPKPKAAYADQLDL